MKPMKTSNYEAAYLKRFQDTRILHDSRRWTAAMHWEGCTIECLLKAIVLAQIPKLEERHWSTDEHPQPHGIKCPKGHDLLQSLALQQKLYRRAQKFPQVIQWLRKVQTPGQDFIDLRYEAEEASETAYKEWWDAYDRLRGWLEKQKTQL